MKYPVSLTIDYYEDLSVEKAIEILAKAGFTHGEFSVGHLLQMLEKSDPITAGKTLRQCADSHGFTIPQGHLSFFGGLCDDSALERLKPELDMFATAGIQKAILHTGGGKDLSDEERYDRWIYYVRKLSEYVEGTGVTLCIENMFTVPQCRTATQIKAIINDAGGKNLGVCLDTGHLHLSREQKKVEQTHREFILESGDLLQALHITDNNGSADTHQMPYSARFGVNWHEVIAALDAIAYKGIFNLESIGERIAPLPIRKAKLAFILRMCDYMLSEEFLADGYDYPPYEWR